MQRWIAQDPDPETRTELETLVASDTPTAGADLADRFAQRLAFGTAGLRGALGGGPNRMNRVVVSQASAGLAAHLLAQAGRTQAAGLPESQQIPTALIGFDGRRNSAMFADDAAAILAGAGIRALRMPQLGPTPLLAFAVRHLNADAGVMITASHNPPNDNGMKVYLGGSSAGAQLVSPDDAAIAAHIDRIADSVRVTDLPRGTFAVLDDAVLDAYVAQTAAVAPAVRQGAKALAAATAAVCRTGTLGAEPSQPLRVAYTPMHGVGWASTRQVLDVARIPLPATVTEQLEPDGRFPTVAFPNPEEPGAMDCAFATGRATDADLIIAQDPDADRLAVGVPDAANAARFRRLTGNETGLLLGWLAAEQEAHANPAPSATAPPATLACSIVSSPGLAVIARAYGLRHVETLTGFKWISRAPSLAFGFEEALGYLVNPDTVHDKDGISAAVAILALATELHAAGCTLTDALTALTARFGAFASSQISIRVTDLSIIASAMARLRHTPPTTLGGLPVTRIDDLAAGSPDLPPSNVLRIVLPDARVMVRPSGTEPKLKAYLDVTITTGSPAERASTASALLTRIETDVRALVA